MKITLTQNEAREFADSALRSHLPSGTCLEVELQNPLPISLCRLHKGELTRLLSDFAIGINPERKPTPDEIRRFLVNYFGW